jgi:hypothetical protein
MAKFKDSKGNELIDSSVVLNELKTSLNGIIEIEEGAIVEDENEARELFGAEPYEYTITFPVTFSNFDYEKMAEYGFTDEKLRSELSSNIAKNIYDGVIAIILNGEAKNTESFVDRGLALNYALDKSNHQESDKITVIDTDDKNKVDVVNEVIKYQLDTFNDLFGVDPNRVMSLGYQSTILSEIGYDAAKQTVDKGSETSSKDAEFELEYGGRKFMFKPYEVHRNDNGLFYLYIKDESVAPFIVRFFVDPDSDVFKVAVYKRNTTKALYCKIYE